MGGQLNLPNLMGVLNQDLVLDMIQSKREEYLSKYILSFVILYTSCACSIPDPDTNTVIITGGRYTETTVSVYGLQGWLEDLTPLSLERWWHGCTSFTSGESRVSGIFGTYVYINGRGIYIKLYYLRY